VDSSRFRSFDASIIAFGIQKNMASKTGTPRDTLLEAFTTWGTGDMFTSQLDAWMQSHCEGFEAATTKGEQDLRWGNTFSEYNEWLDRRLEDFCSREECTHKEVMAALSTAVENGGAEFLPVFMSNTVYPNFLQEMCNRANESEVLSSAKVARMKAFKKNDSVNLSGIWLNDPSGLDKPLLNRLMKIAGSPWVFRKLFATVASTKNISLCIEQNKDRIRITSKFKFFGSSVTTLSWGRPTRVYNFWRKVVTCTASIDEKRGLVCMHMDDVDYYPAGSKVCHTWQLKEDGKAAVFTIGVTLPDGEELQLPFRMKAQGSVGK